MPERKAREFQRRETEILQSAFELFEDEQWEKVTVAQIARHAGIGKGTVYKHFVSKEEIYARLILDDSFETLDEFQEILQQDNDPVTQIRGILQLSLQKYSEESTINRLHFHCKPRSFRERLSESYREEFERCELAFMNAVSPVLERGMAEGSFMSRPLYQTFLGLEAIFDGALLTLRNEDYMCMQPDHNNYTKESYIADMVAFMLSSLTGRADSPTLSSE